MLKMAPKGGRRGASGQPRRLEANIAAPLGPPPPLPAPVRAQVVKWLEGRIGYWKHIKSLERAMILQRAIEEFEA